MDYVFDQHRKEMTLSMSNEITQNQCAGTLPTSRIVAIAIAFCVFVPLAGAVAETIGGWLGLFTWLVSWFVMIVAAVILTRRFANPTLPTLCGIMVGITAPKPSDSWLTSTVGEAFARGISFVITIAAVGIALSVFNAISKHMRESTPK